MPLSTLEVSSFLTELSELIRGDNLDELADMAHQCDIDLIADDYCRAYFSFRDSLPARPSYFSLHP